LTSVTVQGVIMVGIYQISNIVVTWDRLLGNWGELTSLGLSDERIYKMKETHRIGSLSLFMKDRNLCLKSSL